MVIKQLLPLWGHPIELERNREDQHDSCTIKNVATFTSSLLLCCHPLSFSHNIMLPHSTYDCKKELGSYIACDIACSLLL